MQSSITIRHGDRSPQEIETGEGTLSLQVEFGSIRVFISSHGVVDVDATGENTLVLYPRGESQVRLESSDGH